MNSIFASLVIYLLWIAVAVLIYIVVAIFFIDLQLLNLQKKLRNIPTKKYAKLAIVIYTHNHAATIYNCLHELYKTNLRSLEIIVVDNASSDSTKQIITAFQKKYPKFQFQTVFKTKTSKRRMAVEQGRQKTSKQKTVIVMNGNILLNKSIITTLRQLEGSKLSIPVSFTLPVLPKIEANYLSITESYLVVGKHLLQKTFVFMRIIVPKESESEAYVLSAQATYKDVPQLTKFSFLVGLKRLSTYQLPKYKSRMFPLILLWIIFATYALWIAATQTVTGPLLAGIGIFALGLVIQLVAVSELTKQERVRVASTILVSFLLLYVVTLFSIICKISSLKTKLTTRVIN